MVDTWQPNSGNDTLSTETLMSLANIIHSEDSAKNDINAISESDIQLIANLINTPEDVWLKAIEPLKNDQILNLCRVFTLGEMAFSNWSFAGKNPTIYFLRYLKAQKVVVEKDFIRWLKKNTDNRYIPFGPAL